MLKTRLTTLIFTLVLVVSACATAIAAKGNGRAVSLNALAVAVKSGDSARYQSMCGVTKVIGYLVDPASKDIILVGKVDPTLPKLHLDDFVVALRNAWFVYTKVEGNTRYYSPPGCSIDPDPKVLRQLNDLRDAQAGLLSQDTFQQYSDDWKTIGAQPQNVRVLGVPFDSRFAKVMVDADYYMKRIVNGSVALGIDGLVSLTEMHEMQARQEMAQPRDSEAPPMSLNRFWFSPGETTYELNDGLTRLRKCTVKLLTEEEFLTERNVVSGYGRPDPMAGNFAKSFTAKYTDISAARPIYYELDALFRFAAIARLMKDDNLSAPGLAYLLKKYKVGVVPVSRAVNGLTVVQEIEETIDTPNGRVKRMMVQSTCGGVSMDVRPKRVAPARVVAPKVTAAVPKANTSEPTHSVTHSTQPPRATTQATRKAPRVSIKHVVLSKRTSPKAVSWDVPLDDLE